MKRLFVHIGAHKSASTTIQNILRSQGLPSQTMVAPRTAAPCAMGAAQRRNHADIT